MSSVILLRALVRLTAAVPQSQRSLTLRAQDGRETVPAGTRADWQEHREGVGTHDMEEVRGDAPTIVRGLFAPDLSVRSLPFFEKLDRGIPEEKTTHLVADEAVESQEHHWGEYAQECQKP